MYKRIGISLLMYMGMSYLAFGQALDNTTWVFDQFMQNYHLVNPSNQDTAYKYKIQLGNRSLTNLFDGVQRLYGDVDVRWKHTMPTRQSNVGLLVTHSRDGAFISKSSFYGRYGWGTNVSPRSRLTVGLAIGGLNYAILGSQADPGGSDWALDGNMGIWYQHTRFKVGVAYMQLFGQSIRPIRQSFRLQPYWNFNLQGTIFQTRIVKLRAHLLVNNLLGNAWLFECAPVFEITPWVEIGTNYRQERGVAVLFGLKSIPVLQGKLQIMASYMFSTQPVGNVYGNVVELSMGFSH